MDLQRTNKPTNFRDPDSKKSAPVNPPKYTTRQIMELTERRRKMEEAAALSSKPQLPEASQVQDIQSQSQTKTEPEKAPILESKERISGDLFVIKEETPDQDIAAQEPTAADASLAETERQVRENIMDFVPRSATVKPAREPLFAKPSAQFKSTLIYISEVVMDCVLTAGSFILFTLMLTHALGLAASAPVYEPGPFLLLAALLMVWSTRRKLYKGQRSLVVGATAFVLGFAVFTYGAFIENVYLELAGFIGAAIGIIGAHYTKEAASRLVFPLAFLGFAIAPPALSPEVLAQLNILVAEASAFVLRVLHIPTVWSANAVKMGDYTFFLTQDSGVYRSLMCALPLIALYAYHRYRTTAFRKCTIFLSAIPFVFLGAIAHRVGTGWLSYTYGPSYAEWFFESLGLVVLLALGLFAAIDAFIRTESEIV